MWLISRVTVLLPLVPLIDTIGIRRSASRIHDGGVVLAASIRADHRSTSRVWEPVRRAVGAGETLRSVRARAASTIARVRSAPDHGKVTIQCPGSDDRWTARPPRPSPCSERSRRSHVASAAMPSGHSLVGTARPRWTRA